MSKIRAWFLVFSIMILMVIVVGCSDSSQTEMPALATPSQEQAKSNRLDVSVEQNKPTRNQQSPFIQPRVAKEVAVKSRVDDVPIQDQGGPEAEEEMQRITESIGELAINPSDDAAREHLSQQLKDADLYRRNMLKQAKSEMAPN